MKLVLLLRLDGEESDLGDPFLGGGFFLPDISIYESTEFHKNLFLQKDCSVKAGLPPSVTDVTREHDSRVQLAMTSHSPVASQE